MVASWRDRACLHCKQVHQHLFCMGKLDLVHVQDDEIRVKGRKIVVWMGLAMMNLHTLMAKVLSQTQDR